jgi:hypothetical protein
MTTRAARGGSASTRGDRGGAVPDARALKPSSTNAARACLEHLCDCLGRLGVGTSDGTKGDDPTALTAETLRRAKFDQPAARAPLWRALHDLCLAHRAGFPDAASVAETLRTLRASDAETARDETDETRFPHEHARGDSQRGTRPGATLAEDARVETHAPFVVRSLMHARYPRVKDFTSVPEKKEIGSRRLLIAFAWYVCRVDVFARAHFERCARIARTSETRASSSASSSASASSASVVAAVGSKVSHKKEELPVSSPSLSPARAVPPYARDAASSPRRAKAAAARFVAEEAEYIRSARMALESASSGAPGSRMGFGKTKQENEAFHRESALNHQTACLANRLWHTVSNVRCLERARAVRRFELFEAQTGGVSRKGSAAGSGMRRSIDATTIQPLTATEVAFARDSLLRNAAVLAMKATISAKEHAANTMRLAETFWAWMRSAIELEEKEREDEEREADSSEGDASEGDSRRSASEPETVLESSDASVSIAALEEVTRRVAPLLRSRRRDIEIVARGWRAARETAKTDPAANETLSRLASAAAARLPSLSGFEAAARSKRKREREREDARIVDTESDASLASLFQSASLRDPDPPDAVVSALRRKGFGKRVFAENGFGSSGDHRDFESSAKPDESLTLTAANASGAWFGSSLRGEPPARADGGFAGGFRPSAPNAARSETCAEAAERLRETLMDAEGLVEAQRKRAALFLREKVTRAFGAPEEPGKDGKKKVFVCHGW